MYICNDIFMLNAIDIEKKIRERYNDANFTVEKLAEELHISESYLREIIYINFFMSPQRLIETIRIQKALECLLKDEKVYITAGKIGYSNIRSFRRAFSKRLGLTPCSFRTRTKTYGNEFQFLKIINKILWSKK